MIGSIVPCGRAAWPPMAGDVDGEFVGRGHQRAGPGGEFADRQSRHVVHAVDLLDVPALHQPVVDHRLAAGAAFLGGLEDDHRRAVEIARLGEVAGRPEEHRGVAVMAAGMHAPVDRRGPGLAGGLAERQGVHVGAEPDHLAACRFPPADDADHAGPADAGRYLVDAEGAELLGDGRRRAVDLVEDLGVAMEVAPPGDDIIVELGKAIDDRHGYSRRWSGADYILRGCPRARPSYRRSEEKTDTIS